MLADRIDKEIDYTKVNDCIEMLCADSINFLLRHYKLRCIPVIASTYGKEMIFLDKICFTASSGGHLEEILGLVSLNDRYSSFLITEKTDFKPNVWHEKIYTVPAVNRQDFFCYLKLLVILFKSFIIFLSEKPDVVISTGALMTVPVCLLAKIMKKKVVFVESIARVSSGSAAGLFLYRFADLFIIQWESLRNIYPNAVFGGKII